MIYYILGAFTLLFAVRAWRSRPDITAADAIDILEGNGILIDVRTPAEFRSGHRKGSVNVPLDQLPEGLKKHSIAPESTILLVCASGMRSAKAKSILKRAGFTNIFNAGAVHRLIS